MTFLRNALSRRPRILSSGHHGRLPPATGHAAGITLPVQCEVGTETVLPWDDVAYDLRGTCGVVRLSGDRTTVTMPVGDAPGHRGRRQHRDREARLRRRGRRRGQLAHHPVPHLPGPERRRVDGRRVRAGRTSRAARLRLVVDSDTINVLRLRSTDTVTARKAYRTRITGSDNSLVLIRADRLVLTGDRNSVTVARGRTTLRDRGDANVLDLRRRRRRPLPLGIRHRKRDLASLSW